MERAQSRANDIQNNISNNEPLKSEVSKRITTRKRKQSKKLWKYYEIRYMDLRSVINIQLSEIHGIIFFGYYRITHSSYQSCLLKC